MTKYNNCDWGRLARTGGAVRVTIGFDADYGPLGVYPTSLPCRGCWVSPRDPDIVMSIGTGRDPTLRGDYIPVYTTGGKPVWVPISDVSQLYFSGTEQDVIDIVYLIG